MKLLLDTHVLLWSAVEPERLSRASRTLLDAEENELFFSVASVWETAVKRGLERPDFQIDVRRWRQKLIETGFREIVVTGEHALAVLGLPKLHGDPFDRLLIAQATVERMTLITNDRSVLSYPGPILEA